MRSQERELRAALDALSQHIALLDDRGRVLIANRAWREFAADNGGDPEAVGVGANFYDVTERHKVEVELQRAKRLAGPGALAGGIAHDFNPFPYAQLVGEVRRLLEDRD